MSAGSHIQKSERYPALVVCGGARDLLEEAGVDTVVELSRRNPENLHAKILEVNEEKKLVRRLPTLEKVREWIERAKRLPRKVEY